MSLVALIINGFARLTAAINIVDGKVMASGAPLGIAVDLGVPARRSGSFSIIGTGLPVGAAVLIAKAAGPFQGKGTRADEAEMDLITASARVISATEIRVFWQSRGPVRGFVNFIYQIGAS